MPSHDYGYDRFSLHVDLHRWHVAFATIQPLANPPARHRSWNVFARVELDWSMQ